MKTLELKKFSEELSKEHEDFRANRSKDHRLKSLCYDLLILQRHCEFMKPKEKEYYLRGFCTGKFYEDIIYQICFLSGRDPITEIANFLTKNNIDHENSSL